MCVPAGICGCLLVSDAANWYLRVHTCVSVCLLVSECAYLYLCAPTGA